MTLTITLLPAMLIVASIALFLAATWFLWWQGLFDGSHDPFGMGFLFCIAIYSVFWLIPSLTGWAVWATWFRQVTP